MSREWYKGCEQALRLYLNLDDTLCCLCLENLSVFKGRCKCLTYTLVSSEDEGSLSPESAWHWEHGQWWWWMDPRNENDLLEEAN